MSKILNQNELLQFCQQFSIIVKAGISPQEGLAILRDDTSDGKTAEMLDLMIEDLYITNSLAETMKNSGYFPDFFVSYIKAGEETGSLDNVLESLEAYYQQQIDVADFVQSSLVYPLIMLGMAGVVIVVLLVTVLPVFQQVFRQMGLEMTGISSALLSFGTVLSRFFVPLVIIVAALLIFIIAFFLTPKGKKALSRLSFTFPGVKNISRDLAYSRVTHAMALGLHSGFEPLESLNLAIGLADHPDINEKMLAVKEKIQSGESFSDSLKAAGFSSTNARLLKIGILSGRADEVMERVSKDYNSKALEKVDRILSIVEPSIVILLSVLVGLVLISVMMPLLGILSDMLI